LEAVVGGIEELSVKIRNYKCVGQEEQGFDKILPINLVIGRNNSGKSTLLELIQYAISGLPTGLVVERHQGKDTELIFSHLLDTDELQKVFPSSNSEGGISGNHWEYGKKWVGKRLTWGIRNNQRVFMKTDPPYDIKILSVKNKFENLTANVKSNPLEGKMVRRLSEARDIVPEHDDSNLNLDQSGRGGANIIQNYLNKVSYPTYLVKEILLRELNNIFVPDSTFQEILCQQWNDNRWEIYLEEKGKGSIPLSRTGSGLKTILLVLIILHLIPHIEKKQLSEYIFCLEELENNLHPALQRRLLIYLRDIALKENCTFFLATHSNVAIDLFSHDKHAQIIHVTHDGEKAEAKAVKTYIEQKGVLDDLDIRASDLLQSNGIVWVEGPSDRLYFNRWIELLTDGELREGTHYQCVLYGGRLLAHLTADEPREVTGEWIEILRVNRNAIMIIDSDKRSKGGKNILYKNKTVGRAKGD